MLFTSITRCKAKTPSQRKEAKIHDAKTPKFTMQRSKRLYSHIQPHDNIQHDAKKIYGYISHTVGSLIRVALLAAPGLTHQPIGGSYGSTQRFSYEYTNARHE